MVDLVSITHQFNGDAAAANLVDAAQLDTQLGNLAATIDAEIIARQKTSKDSGGLANQSVRFTALHPEIVTSLAGLFFLQDVTCATSANITLSGLQTIDGYVTLAGDRVLVNGQTDATQNGIYAAASGAWTRTSDASGLLTTSFSVAVLNGTSYAGTSWRVFATATAGSGQISWIQIQGFSTLLPLSRGGTGANSAAGARTALGLGGLAILSQVAQANLASDVFYQVDTIAALKALAAGASNTVFVRGYWSVTGQGGGVFVWNSSDATADNGGTVIIPNSAPGTGRWNRVSYHYQLNVREFGAKGDNSTDDTAAIQSAINVAQAASGGMVYFPQGNYIVSNELLITGNSVILEGQATSGNIGGGSRIITTSTTKDVIRVSTVNQSVSGFEVHGLSLYGAGAGATTGSGLYLQSDVAGRVLQTVRINNVACLNCKEHGFRFSAASSTSFIFDMAMGNLVATGNGKNGLRADGNVIQTQVGKIYSASNLCTGGAGGQIAIVGVAGVTTPTNWLFSSPVAANNPAVANSAGVYLELARGITMQNVWHESNLNAEFILKSCLNVRVIGGNVAQAGTTDGVVIGFSGANACGNITIDIDNWVLTSSKKHVDISQFSGGSFSLPIYLGNTADGPLTPTNVTGWGITSLPDLFYFSANQPHLRSVNCTRLATPQSGTWTASGQPVSWTRTSANNTTQSIAFEVPLAPMQTSTFLKGIKPSSVKVVYEVTGADAGDDVQIVVQTQAQPADNVVTPGPASVAGTYDAAHATAAQRSNSVGGHQYNTAVLTFNSPAWLGNDVEMYCIIQAVEANNASNALSVIVRSVIFYYSEAMQ